MMFFVYKGKQYSWTEWNDEFNEFINKLPYPENIEINFSIREFSLLFDVGYGIAFDKFIELREMIASARFALINAYKKFYDDNIIPHDNPYQAHLWMRFQYLKNAIVWYNSCEDYINQIIWFSFELFPHEIKTEEAYKNNLKSCSYKSIIKKLELLKGKYPDSQLLINMINSYRQDPDVAFLREELANNLKHRANLQVNGLENTRIGSYIKKSNNEQVFDSKLIKPIIIDIDDVVWRVQSVHSKLLSYATDLLEFMNIEEMFTLTEDGSINATKPRKKTDYKKIIGKI